MNWKDHITKINSNSADKTISFAFNSPTTDLLLEDLKLEFNLDELPSELEELYRQTNGIEHKMTVDNIGELTIGELIWTVERTIETNKEYRNYKDFKDLYMSFEQLLFFSDAGNGDLFGIVTLNGKFDRHDIFSWNHEDDSRNWVAPNLAKFIEWWLDGKINV
jgi:hypothetical protein